MSRTVTCLEHPQHVIVTAGSAASADVHKDGSRPGAIRQLLVTTPFHGSEALPAPSTSGLAGSSGATLLFVPPLNLGAGFRPVRGTDGRWPLIEGVTETKRKR